MSPGRARNDPRTHRATGPRLSPRRSSSTGLISRCIIGVNPEPMAFPAKDVKNGVRVGRGS